MAWEATADSSDCLTPVNMTNHAYWNLSGDFKDVTITDHQLNLNCDHVLPMSPSSIPSGEIQAVAGTPFDFTGSFSTVGAQQRLSGAIDGGGMPGIDHAFLINRDNINSKSFTKVGTL